MVVGCPKCKVKLKVDDGKIKPEGLKIKCPKCATLLMVRRPAAAPVAPAAPAAKPAISAPARHAPPIQPKPPVQPPPATPARPAAPPVALARPAAHPAAPHAGGGLRAPEGPQPIEAQAKALNPKKIIVAHENAKLVETAMMQLMERGYLVIPLPSGVDTLVQAMKELPFLVILDAALPKIDGFEIIKRLREKAETKDIRTVVVSSKTDARRQRKQPPAMYGVDAYIDDDELSRGLIAVVTAVVSGQPIPESAPAAPAMPVAPAAVPAAPAAPARPVAPAAPTAAPTEAPAAPAKSAGSSAAPAAGGLIDREAEKARRLARIVLSDIDLYDPEKVADAIRSGQFETVFAEGLREGLKHYQNRIPKEVRARGNFFQESLDEFIAKKKKTLGIA